MVIRHLALDQIISNQNIRSTENIEELAASMWASGQVIEIRVFPMGGKFVVISGHRRVAAAQKLGWETIRAIIEERPTDEAGLLTAMYNENNQREGMDYLTKAAVFDRLHQLGMNQTEIASRFGIKQAEVSLALSMMRAHPKLQEAINTGRISPSAAEPLLPLSQEEQENLVDTAVREKTVRRVKALVQTHKAKGSTKKAETVESEYDPLELITYDSVKEVAQKLRAVSYIGKVSHPNIVANLVINLDEIIAVSMDLKRVLLEA